MRRSLLLFLSLAAVAAHAQTQISDNATSAISENSKWVLGSDSAGFGNVTLLNRSTGYVFHYQGQHVGLGTSNGGFSLLLNEDYSLVTSYGNDQTLVAYDGSPALAAGAGTDSSMDARTGTVAATNQDPATGDITSYDFATDGTTNLLPSGNGDFYLLSVNGTKFATNGAGGLDAYRNGAFVALPTPGGTPNRLRADQDGFGAIAAAGLNEGELVTYRFDGAGNSSAIVWDFGDGGTVKAFTDLDHGVGLVVTTGGTYQIDALSGSFVPYAYVPAGYTLTGGFSRDSGLYGNLVSDETGLTTTWTLPTASPVPEPAGMAGLGLGLTALAVRKRGKA